MPEAYTKRKEMIAGIEQRAVYDCLVSLNQDEYVDLRKYFIEHPITSMEEVRKLKLIYAENGIALQAIDNAYEPVRKDCYVCPRCGWTLQKEKVGMRCQSRACTKEEKYIHGELQALFI